MSAPILDKQAEIETIYQRYLEPEPAEQQGPRDRATTPPSDDDTALLDKIRESKQGAKFKLLFDHGDTSDYANGKHEGRSEADLALCGILGFWTNWDEARVDKLFRQSKLMRPKWDEMRGETTYGELTITKAFEGHGEGYQGTSAGFAGSKPGGAENFSEDEDPWQPLEELPDLYPPVPGLPAEMLPEPLQGWLEDIAERTCLPLEFVACPALVALGAVVGRTVGIHPKRHDDWLVVPNLWGGIVGRPGLMKSAAISEATKPLSRLAVEARKAFEEAHKDAEAERTQLELEIAVLKEQAKRDAKKGGIRSNFQETIRELQTALADVTVTERRYMTQDPTTEKLGELCQENPRGMLVLRDELAGWLRTLERPGREGDREFYLEGWNGTQGFVFDRIGRGTVHIKALTVSILGGIQPGKLEHYLQEALKGGSGADGLLQRFQLVVWPDHPGEWVNVDRYPDTEAKNRAYEVFEALDQLEPKTLGLTPNEESIPALRFTADAQALFDTWRDALERRLRSSEFDHKPAFESHLSKYRSLMPSLALLFHLVDVVDGKTPGPVSLEAAQLAADWCEYLEAHALKLYAPEISAHIKAARELAVKIEEGAIEDGATVKSIYDRQWSGLETKEQVTQGLEVLAERNWLRTEPVSTGGRPSLKIRLHPELKESKG